VPADGTKARGDGHPALDEVRLHRDSRATALTDALGAQAITVGPNVYLSPDAPGLGSSAGRRLLAHELTHVVQQHELGARAQLFTTGERPQIAADLTAMMAVVQAIVTASSKDNKVLMDALVGHAGGSTAWSVLPENSRGGSTAPISMLTLRYLFTKRCGLIDMRHFIQLMYISWFTHFGTAGMAARGATKRGIEHERESERESKFAPEDLTSNALGAWTGTQLDALPRPDAVVAGIRSTLERCVPVDFNRLSLTSQSSLVSFYAAQSGAGEPLNQNTTAVALIPDVPELAGSDRSFPFDLDTDDPNRATIESPAFTGGSAGLTGDTEIRRFVAVQRDEVLVAIPQDDRVRLCVRLIQGWVSDDDLDAFERLYRSGNGPAHAAIQAAAPPTALSGGQHSRLSVLYRTWP